MKHEIKSLFNFHLKLQLWQTELLAESQLNKMCSNLKISVPWVLHFFRRLTKQTFKAGNKMCFQPYFKHIQL